MATTPLLADMFYEIEVLDENHPGAFGQLGAYGQGYSLFGVSLGLSTMAGPAWGGTFLQLTNWQILAGTMAALSVVGSIPVHDAMCFTGMASRRYARHTGPSYN